MARCRVAMLSYVERMKTLTRQQLGRRKEQAVRFTRDVLEDDDRADEIEDESLRRLRRRPAHPTEQSERSKEHARRVAQVSNFNEIIRSGARL